MDAIEIFFAFYGVLLALAAAKVLSGAARVVAHRKTISIGWTTPLLMLLLLFDLASFVTSAWRNLGAIDVEMRLVFSCMLAAGAYYVSALLMVPEDLAKHPDLDAWFTEHKRFAVGGILAANILGFELVQMMIKGPLEGIVSRWSGFTGVMNLAFYTLVAVLFVIRNRATNIVMLATLNAMYLVVLIAF